MVYFEQFYFIFYVQYDITGIYFSGGIVVMSLDNSVKVPSRHRLSLNTKRKHPRQLM